MNAEFYLGCSTHYYETVYVQLDIGMEVNFRNNHAINVVNKRGRAGRHCAANLTYEGGLILKLPCA